jgi:hypothetical protein
MLPEVKNDLDCDEDEDGAWYILALHKDKRHFMTEMHHFRYTRRATGKGELRDRREVPKTTEGGIQLTGKQVMPAGPKKLILCINQLIS